MSWKLLFGKNRFWPLFWTQFLGALNDNLLKNALVVLITFKGVALYGLETSSLVALSGGIFILPFFLFSPLAGQISDRFERSKIVRFTKVWEFLIMIIAALGFYFESYEMLLFVLFLMGVQSTFFGPVKYSIIPDLVHEDQLTESNAYIELGTFVAILLGTIGGGMAVSVEGAGWIVSSGLLMVSLIGLWFSYQLKPVAIAAPHLKVRLNPFPTMVETLKHTRQSKAIFNSILGISWFWFFGAGLLSILPLYCKNHLQANEAVVTLFLAMFTIGIGFGSILCEKLSFKRVEIGLVPIGSLGMTLFMLDLYLVEPTWTASALAPLTISELLNHTAGIRLLVDFFVTSMFGGIFIVPLYALIQERSAPETRSRVIAGNNILNALFMVISSLIIMGLYAYNFTEPETFAILAIMNALVAIYIYSIVPEFTLRLYSWFLAHMLYRLKIKGLDNIPKEGPVILTCNHISFIDWLIIFGACPRPVRFVMHYRFFDIPIVQTLMRQAHVIPIAGKKENPEVLEKAFQMISKELDAGEVVCIFPEGTITRSGQVNPFRPGILKILKSNPAPVVPMALKGLWGSLFSRKDGPALLKPPRKLWKRIDLEIAEPVAPESFDLSKLESQIKTMLGEEPQSSPPATAT